jgi:alpha-methylacyl-CoA racemase
MKLLEGIKIIDFTRLLPGPMATHLLAQMGAEVIKIESPKRLDYVRYSGIQVDGASILFHQINHDKEMRMVDYSTKEGMEEIHELVRGADAIMEQFRPGAMDAWGLGYEDIKKINPNIVYVSLTGYGHDNDYSAEAGHDFNYLSYTGIMGLMKDDNGKPTVSDTQFADISGAYMAVMATQSALLQKTRTGEGCFVDVSIADSMNPFLTIPYALFKGGLNYRQFNIINGKTTANYSAYECNDKKWLSVAAMEPKFWNNICDVVGKLEWKRNSEMELMNHAFPKEEVADFFKTRSRDEWMGLFKGKDVCVAPILEIEELEESDYHQSKKTFKTFKTKEGTELQTVDIPFKVKK